jgi:hypothetical protein
MRYRPVVFLLDAGLNGFNIIKSNKEKVSQFFDMQSSIQIFQGLHEILKYVRILVYFNFFFLTSTHVFLL